MNLVKVLFFLFFAKTNLFAQINTQFFDTNSIKVIIFLNENNWPAHRFGLKVIPITISEAIRIDCKAKEFVIEKSRGIIKNQGFSNCPVISESFSEYIRQVICFKDQESNDEIVWIRFVYKSVLNDHPDWKDFWVVVSGGCSNYWSIKYNRTKKQFFDYQIN